MTTEIIATSRAEQQIATLSRTHAKALDVFIDELGPNGCRALGYRLTGQTPLDRICVKHLRDNLRAVVAFEKPERIWILLVGPHDDKDPNRDVYTELYAILGVEPPNAGRRAKPSCCGEDGQPPAGLGDDLADIIIRSVKQRRTRARAR